MDFQTPWTLTRTGKTFEVIDSMPSGLALTATVGVVSAATRTGLPVLHRLPHRRRLGPLVGVSLTGLAGRTASPGTAALGPRRCHDLPATEEERSALYRSLLAGRRTLVLLDNAGSVDQVRPLLPGSSRCATIVTSRDSLAGLVARDGARRLDLTVLSQSAAVQLLETLIGDRAGADPRATAAIAARCSRLPLALRVAAELATFRHDVPLGSLAAQLADKQRRLDMLETSQDPLTAVRAVFSWSYRHLDRATARGFALLGLMPCPTADAYAAAGLTGRTPEQAMDMLEHLGRVHLMSPDGHGRYGMHDLLKEYAAEQATRQTSAAERRDALTGLFDYYQQVAAIAVTTLFPADRQRLPTAGAVEIPIPPVTEHAAARDWLDSELPNMLAIAGYAATHDWPGHAISLATILARYLSTHGYYADALSLHGRALEAARGSGDRHAEATALTDLGQTDHWQGRYLDAASRQQAACAIFRELRDEARRAHWPVLA